MVRLQRCEARAVYRWPQLAAACAAAVTLIAGVWAPGLAQTSATLSVSVQAEAVAISVTGGSIDFGGPHAANTTVQAHPQETIRETLPPTLTNTGNVDLSFVQVAYSGVVGSEASCDSGTTSWAAHASTAATDRFVMRAWASTSTTFSTFNSNAFAITPGTGSANILAASNTPLVEDAAVPILLELRMPNPPVAGAGGCAIGLTVTAGASG